MKTIVVVQQKGGVGKTALAVHLAWYVKELGSRVAYVDLDSQHNGSSTLSAFDRGMKASEMFTRPGSIAAQLASQDPEMGLLAGDDKLTDIDVDMKPKQAAGAFLEGHAALAAHGYDFCVIDTATALGPRMAAALLASDYVLCPIEPEAYSIQGIQKMLTTIANIKTVNTKLEFLGIALSKVDARSERHTRHVAELREAYPQLVIPHVVYLRGSVADALATGNPVWTDKRTAARSAAKDVRNLAAHLCEKMEIV